MGVGIPGLPLATAVPVPIRLLLGHACPPVALISTSLDLHFLMALLLKLNLVLFGSVIVSVFKARGWSAPGSSEEMFTLKPVGFLALVAVSVMLDFWTNWELAYATPAVQSSEIASSVAVTRNLLIGCSP